MTRVAARLLCPCAHEERSFKVCLQHKMRPHDGYASRSEAFISTQLHRPETPADHLAVCNTHAATAATHTAGAGHQPGLCCVSSVQRTSALPERVRAAVCVWRRHSNNSPSKQERLGRDTLHVSCHAARSKRHQPALQLLQHPSLRMVSRVLLNPPTHASPAQHCSFCNAARRLVANSRKSSSTL